MVRIGFIFFVLLCCVISCKKGSDGEGYESYRYELWKKCIQNNYQIDFVGQQYDDGTYPNFMGSPLIEIMKVSEVSSQKTC